MKAGALQVKAVESSVPGRTSLITLSYCGLLWRTRNGSQMGQQPEAKSCMNRSSNIKPGSDFLFFFGHARGRTWALGSQSTES